MYEAMGKSPAIAIETEKINLLKKKRKTDKKEREKDKKRNRIEKRLELMNLPVINSTIETLREKKKKRYITL